ncbi:hypothetical protein DdX_04215 [Ditylenchus destructor]|uniref:Uncharacterized protein n=1 Tax=Ditylenchus destructor TaxID=166010 RepID=A0AAD4RAT9_9BILA|nr:hypothetical protein DdX_04215 [Ditylenchus destructor]
MRPTRAVKAPQPYQATMKSQKQITIEKKIERLLANGESPAKKNTSSPMRTVQRKQFVGTPSQLENGESSAKKDTSSDMRAMQRKQFVGTPSQLRKQIKQILEPRFRGNIPVDSIVNILTEAVVKDQEFTRMMAENGVTMELLLAAYNFCGKYIALESMDLTDVPPLEGTPSTPALEAGYATSEEYAEQESP